MVRQSNPHELRKNLDRLLKTTTGVYSFFWSYPIKIPINNRKSKTVFFFDRQYSEWIIVEPVVIVPSKEQFTKEELFDIPDQESHFGILYNYQVTIQKIDESFVLKVLKVE
jgi:hypothetical protein